MVRDHQRDRVAGVEPEGPAATAGLQVGDRIVSVNGQPVDPETLAGIRFDGPLIRFILGPGIMIGTGVAVLARVANTPRSRVSRRMKDGTPLGRVVAVEPPENMDVGVAIQAEKARLEGRRNRKVALGVQVQSFL